MSMYVIISNSPSVLSIWGKIYLKIPGGPTDPTGTGSEWVSYNKATIFSAEQMEAFMTKARQKDTSWFEHVKLEAIEVNQLNVVGRLA